MEASGVEHDLGRLSYLFTGCVFDDASLPAQNQLSRAIRASMGCCPFGGIRRQRLRGDCARVRTVSAIPSLNVSINQRYASNSLVSARPPADARSHGRTYSEHRLRQQFALQSGTNPSDHWHLSDCY